MLRVENLSVAFGHHHALDGVSIDVADGSVVAILGPSGAGKTSLLRAIAGLTRPDAGVIAWDSLDITTMPAHRRGFGLMFQDFALFPHKDVAGNVEFGLRMQRLDATARAAAVETALAMVGLAGYQHRAVGTLSGGEAQRVALARALAPQPKMLMLDEPLGSLDAALRQQLLADLSKLLDDLGTTAIYVTHDQAEAFAVADRLVVLRAGAVTQSGTPEEVWLRPRNEFVARFLGLSNFVDATIERGQAETIWGIIPVGHRELAGHRRLVLRPDALRVTAEGEIEGVVEDVKFRGDRFDLRVRPAQGSILTLTTRHRLGLGAAVRLAVDPDGVVILGDEGSQESAE